MVVFFWNRNPIVSHDNRPRSIVLFLVDSLIRVISYYTVGDDCKCFILLGLLYTFLTLSHTIIFLCLKKKKKISTNGHDVPP